MLWHYLQLNVLKNHKLKLGNTYQTSVMVPFHAIMRWLKDELQGHAGWEEEEGSTLQYRTGICLSCETCQPLALQGAQRWAVLSARGFEACFPPLFLSQNSSKWCVRSLYLRLCPQHEGMWVRKQSKQIGFIDFMLCCASRYY